MCAYFFAAKHESKSFELDQTGLETKNMIINPSFKGFPDPVKNLYKFNASEMNINIIKELTFNTRNKLIDLKAIDKEISAAFTLGIIASFSSFIPFSWLLAPAALIYTGYLAKDRDAAYKEYEESLASLHRCCDWAINNGTETTQKIMEDDAVKNMLRELSLAMTIEQMKDIIADGMEPTYFKTLASPEQNITDEDLLKEAYKLYDQKKEQTLNYKLYGYDQGGSIAGVLMKMAVYLKQVSTQAVKDAVVYLSNATAPTA